jgi:hypothetical protein
MASNRHLAVPPIAIRSRRVADPFDGLWDRELRPMLEAHPGLRPVALLEEMQLRHPDRAAPSRLRQGASGEMAE